MGCQEIQCAIHIKISVSAFVFLSLSVNKLLPSTVSTESRVEGEGQGGSEYLPGEVCTYPGGGGECKWTLTIHCKPRIRNKKRRPSRTDCSHCRQRRYQSSSSDLENKTSTSRLRQLCDDGSDTDLIENNGVAPEWRCNLFSSDSIVFNENSITSVITELLQR